MPGSAEFVSRLSCSGRWTPIRIALLLGCLLLTTGCQMSRLTPRTLPREWQAQPTANAQTVDLSRLASRSTARSNMIGRGDVLEVTISAGLSEKDTVTFPVRVNEYGQAELPHVGPVMLDRLELEEAEAAIVTACQNSGLYTSPHVTVTMKRQNLYRITVIGAVKQQGTFEIPASSSDLLHAIVAAGGLSEEAGTLVEIRQPSGRGLRSSEPAVAEWNAGGSAHSLASHATPVGSTGPLMVQVDLASATREGSTSYQLEDGAIVNVERKDPPPIQVQGLVQKPDIYDFPIGNNIRVLGAIAMAGGRSNPVADRILVVRQNPETGEQVGIQISYRTAKDNMTENMLLQPGDMVIVEQTPATVFLDAIRMVGFTIGGAVF